MQDPGYLAGDHHHHHSSSAAVFPAAAPSLPPPFPEQEQLRCPRCDSTNTKFCYYNNYNLSQPRHFCKSCRRYWTKGGSLRNIPVGGASRKNAKRPSPSSAANAAAKRVSPSPSQSPSPPNTAPGPAGLGLGPKPEVAGPVGIGSFTSLLAASGGGQYGNFFDGLGAGPGGGGLGLEAGRAGEAAAGFESTGCWGGGGGSSNNGWPDLAIYTPASRFQ